MIIILFLCYQLIQIVLLPFFFVYLIWRSCSGKPVFGNFWQRIGCVPKTPGKKTIWIHGVSVGEVLAAERLIDEIKCHDLEVAVYLTVGTLGGYMVAQKQLKADVVSLLPFDFLIPMLMAFRRITPSALIIIEADFWPNFVMLARWLKIPIHILNARISERARPRIVRFGWLYRKLFESCMTILTQTEHDLEVFVRLGVPASKVHYLGNIKSYNVEAKKIAVARRLMGEKQEIVCKKQTILLVGSVHSGELDVYLELLNVCRKRHQDLKMIIAPRHFHWKAELERKGAAAGFSYFMWDEKATLLRDNSSLFTKITTDIFIQHDILLVCTLGALFSLYRLADIFYLGGTFVPVGGHNLLEPAVWGVPTIVGPYYHNTKDIADQLERVGALYKVKNAAQLIAQTAMLLEHPELARLAAHAAQQWLAGQAACVAHGVHKLITDL